MIELSYSSPYLIVSHIFLHIIGIQIYYSESISMRNKRKYILWKVVSIWAILFWFPNLCHGNTFTKTIIQDISFQYVTYWVGSDIYKIQVAVSENAIPLEDLSVRHNGITAINGVFFCPADYSRCNGQDYTINERFIEGVDKSFYTDTGARWVFGWDSNWVPILHQTEGINQDLRDSIHEWLWNFPILYADGYNMLEYYHDVGLYDSKMKAPLPRHFICSNKEKKQIIFGRTSSTSLDNLAPALYELWCWDALNLDAGNSSHFIYNWNTLVSWPRNILDGYVIERVWLDTSLLEKKLDTIFQSITPQYKRYSEKIAVKRLSNFIRVIPSIRNDIYEEHSIDLFDRAWERIWYEIQTNDLATLKHLYLLGWLERRLKALKYEIQSGD